MKRSRKFLSLLLTLCLLASLAVLPAAAEGETPQDDPAASGGASTEEPEKPEPPEPETPSHPETPDKPTDPDTPETPDKPTDPDTPETPDKPTDPDTPETPDKPTDPDTPESPDKPTNPDTPENPDKPTNPDNPGNSDKPANPEQPTNPEKPPVTPPPTIGAPSSRALSCSPSSLSFSLQKGETGSGLRDTVTITNNGDYDMTNLRVSASSGFSASLDRSSLAKGSSTTVTVSVKSTSSTGTTRGTVTITAAYVDGTGTNTYEISVSATVTEKGYSISVDPTRKDLGKLTEGYSDKEAEEKQITVKITNKGASSVRMNGVKGNDHFYVNAVRDEDLKLDYDDSASYEIFPKKSLSPGTYTDSIVFQTREGATATFKATIVIEKAVDPLSLNVSTLDFGNAEMGYGTVNSQTVTVKNNTQSTLTLEQPYSYSYEIGSISAKSIPAGGTASFTVRPRNGLSANVYNDSLTVQAGAYSARVNLRFTVMPKIPALAFTDVAVDYTFAADITYVSQKGLMSGKSNNQFKPQDPITRGQLVLILYRLEGQPAVSGTGFRDVASGSAYDNAVKWAAAANITNGGSDGLFKPNEPITRQQLATFLYRYNVNKGYNTANKADLSKFADAAAVSSYAKDAIAWANGAGLVNGTSDGKLNPGGGATRGQAAAILHRFCVSIGR